MEKPKTISGTKRGAVRPAFAIADSSVKPGTLKRFEIPVARVPSGMWLSLPIVVQHGARPGPTLWLSAAVHGDELNGIPIIRELIERLDPRALAGTVIAVPVVNVFGIIMESRYLPDRRDLNRSFPGSPKGSLAAQIAHLFMTHVVERCEYGIDYHTGSDGRTNLPQIRCDLDSDEIRELALAFGAPVAKRVGSAWRFLGLFLLSGAAGALFFSLFHRSDYTLLVGASGGVTGLLGALIRFGFRRPPVFTDEPPHLLGLFHPTVLAWSAVIIALNVSTEFVGSGFGAGDADIAWEAHVGGLLFGLVAISFFDPPRFRRF